MGAVTPVEMRIFEVAAFAAVAFESSGRGGRGEVSLQQGGQKSGIGNGENDRGQNHTGKDRYTHSELSKWFRVTVTNLSHSDYDCPEKS